ncbi:MAG: hypothetical protein AAGA80_15700 [Cyanobacteria bacterium P01_F01_bin.143]
MPNNKKNVINYILKNSNWSDKMSANNRNLNLNAPTKPKDVADKAEGKSQSKSKKRMTISLPSDTAKFLEWLAAEQDISQVEVIRKAIATEYFLQNEIKQGAKVLVKTDTSIKEVIFR